MTDAANDELLKHAKGVVKLLETAIDHLESYRHWLREADSVTTPDETRAAMFQADRVRGDYNLLVGRLGRALSSVCIQCTDILFVNGKEYTIDVIALGAVVETWGKEAVVHALQKLGAALGEWRRIAEEPPYYQRLHEFRDAMAQIENAEVLDRIKKLEERVVTLERRDQKSEWLRAGVLVALTLAMWGAVKYYVGQEVREATLSREQHAHERPEQQNTQQPSHPITLPSPQSSAP